MFRHIACVLVIMIYFFMPVQSYAFDYKKYTKEIRQTRTLTPVQNSVTDRKKSERKNKDSIGREITQKLLEALQSDLVPAKIFNTTNHFSLYFKPAKITKLGIKFKF